MSKNYIGYVGTYTRENSKGIYKFILNTEQNKLEGVEVAAEVGSPTYLSISDDQKYLYSVQVSGDEGGIQAFSIKEESGQLQALNDQLHQGAAPCHVDVSGNYVATGNYHQGTVHLYEVSENGELLRLLSAVEHEGSGPHERQEKPHVHYTAFTPDDRFLIVCDLGTDEIITYAIEDETLVRKHTINVKEGSGPRHVSFHPNGKFAYVLTELRSEVIVLEYNAQEGSFKEIQYISAIPEDFQDVNDASAIHISSDGKFLYTGNRGHNSIAVFVIDEQTGELTHVENVPTEGEWPRDFSLDPSERFIVVANQHTGNLVLFSRDENSGKLQFADSVVDVPEGVCVKFLK